MDDEQAVLHANAFVWKENQRLRQQGAELTGKLKAHWAGQDTTLLGDLLTSIPAGPSG